MKKCLLRVFHVQNPPPIFCLLFFAILLPSLLIAQATRTVSGNVLDSKKAPLQGVSITVKGTTRGTTTDADGHFVLANVPDRGTLVVSSTGFTAQEIGVGSRATFSVTLAEAVNALNDVVVIGYGTRQRRDVTGAVSQVKATQLENENPPSVQDLLRGNVPGLDVSSNTSAKGGGNLLVRGKSSLSAGTSPLIVLDGVIYQGQLADINPNDIATIDVLKDASSAAVFGAKAASGVVLITTKKGSGGKPTVTFNTNIGFADLAMNQPLYDGPGFLDWRTDVFKSINNGGKPYQFNDPRTLPSDISIAQWKAYDGRVGDSVTIWLTRLGLKPNEQQNYRDGKETNWYNMMFQKGLRQDHTVSISSRKEDVSYYMSLNYTNNQGVIVGDKFSTFRTRINLEAKAAKFMTVGINMQFADRDESQVPVTWQTMVNASPYGDKYKADGITLRDSPNDDIGNTTNPFLDNVYTNRLQKENSLFGTIFAKGVLPFGFSYQTNFTPSFQFYRFFNSRSAKDFRISSRGGVATRTEQTTYNWQIDNILNWNKTFGEHQLDATFLVNAEKFQSWRNQIDNEGFAPNDNLGYHNIESGIKPIISSDDQKSTGDALMGRLNYSFKQKYLLTTSIRRDGYSAFGFQNPRATFPSIALGWVLSKEKFVNINWLNYAKLRASWGINGNRDIGRYSALSNLTTDKYQYISPSGAVLLVSQLYVSRLQNPGLKWERTSSYNLGLDFSILKDKIGGSVDVYRKSTKDLLVLRTIPDVTGFRNVLDNIGEVQNRGVEISVNTVNIKNQNFSWRSTINFTLNRNKIAHLYGPVPQYDANGKVIGQIERDDISNRWFIGHDIDEIWDLKTLGVWQQNEATEAAKFKLRPGDFKVEDVDNDGQFSNADRQFIGYRTPRFQWTLRNDFTLFKNIDVSFMLYSNWGQRTAYDQAKNNSGFLDRQNSYRLPYWTPDNPTNDYARLFSSNGSADFSVYRKASFIRLSTVAVAYTLPAQILNRAKIQGLKIYMNVNNAGIYQPNWTFWDVEYGNTPPPRYYSIGLNLTL
jgi:TonB-linked SusC/RagA family outer membrane protein